MDLRKPGLLRALNLPDGNGITNYLISDKVSVNDIVVPSKVEPDLYIIGSGPVPPNPAELMMSSKIGTLINILKESFDHIIIDTAPVGQVVDAFMLAPFIDSTIYLMRYDFTPKTLINIIHKIYIERKLNHPMIVLNDAKKVTGYGYGEGYIETEEKSSIFNKSNIRAKIKEARFF
jgi:Mrp family chromosome partitioning ATPase